MSNTSQSICLILPNWLLIDDFKKYVVIYSDVIPYIYNYKIKQEVVYVHKDVLKEECENFNELYMAISNIKSPHILWGNLDISCWDYLTREGVRQALIDRWIGLVKGGIDININHVKKLLVGINLVTQGCVSYADPCSNLPLNESIDKRLINALLTDLTHCPIHN